jgi:superfamily II RNA helicase
MASTHVEAPLLARLPHGEAAHDPDALLSAFLAYVADAGLTLYPAQEEALLELATGANVILATPTGSGKSLVALAVHFFSLARGERSIYTCPIKALASEKFFELSRALGPDNVGLVTGDGAVNRDAPVLCCTAEVLANMALRDGANADVDHVVVDEFHYYADRERGTAWQVPLLTLARSRFLLMSATFGDTEPFEAALTRINGKPTAVVRSTHRPVPLDFSYRETALHETVGDLLKRGRAPVYLVNFTQRSCAEEAQNLMSVDVASKEEKKAIGEALRGVRFDTPYGKELQRFLRHGIGLHHAGLLPKYRLAVEKLAQKGLLKVISGTDTLGVGVNIPIRTVLFTKLCKFDGEKTAILRVRDFLQISGRAGRKGFDDQGSVVAQAPEHVIENLKLEAKAGSDPVKKRRIVRKKPPDRGYVHWDKATFERLCTAPPEPLTSRFQVSQGMLLNVLSRPGGGCLAMGRLIRASHERPVDKKRLGRTAMAMFKSLVEAKVVEVTIDEDGTKRVVLQGDLQTDFSLNQALSLYLVDTLALLAQESESYALDLLTLVESILENPDLVLMKQVDLLKTRKMAEMKAAGIEYDERIAELDKVEYDKPNKDFVYDTFNAFALKHPWVAAENIRPKSVARDMYEKFLSFSEYVREYALERGEGVLLRYLSDVYKVLLQTVPDAYRTPEVDELTVYFGAMVRQVDSSLLDEWERLRSGEEEAPAPEVPVEPEGSRDITRDERGFTVLVRNELYRLVRAAARRDWDEALAVCEPPREAGAVSGAPVAPQTPAGEPGQAWTRTKLEEAFAPFYAEHKVLRTDPAARAPAHLTLTKGEWQWEFSQVLVDGDDACDWVIAGSIDLEASRIEARPVLKVKRIGT